MQTVSIGCRQCRLDADRVDLLHTLDVDVMKLHTESDDLLRFLMRPVRKLDIQYMHTRIKHTNYVVQLYIYLYVPIHITE